MCKTRFDSQGMILNGFKQKSFFKIGMWHSRPPRDPPPFMANAILNFHFDFPHPSLIKITTGFVILHLVGQRKMDFPTMIILGSWVNIRVRHSLQLTNTSLLPIFNPINFSCHCSLGANIQPSLNY